jgi:carboxymethylenebutenolidase
MTAAPYVNVVALLIGARGRDDVRDFYAHRVVSHIPPAMETVPVSPTIGQGRVVDALIGRFTHAIRMDWLLPGIAPTGTRVAVPLVAIVSCDGDKVAHEHLGSYATVARYAQRLRQAQGLPPAA